MAPAQAETIGTADVEIRARTEAFERDLVRVRQILDKFDSSAKGTAENVKRFDTATQSASRTVSDYERTLSDAERAARAAAAANDNNSRTQAEMVRAILASNEALRKLSTTQSAVNDNAIQTQKTWKQTATGVAEAGSSFVSTGKALLDIAGHLKLALTVATVASPAFRGLVASGLEKWAQQVTPRVEAMRNTFTAMVPAASRLGMAMGQASAATSKVVETIKPFHEIDSAIGLVKLGAAFPAVTAGALALSPALRQVAAKEVKEGIKSVGPAIGTIAVGANTATKALTGGSGLVSVLGGALGFISRIAIPIGIAVAAFDTLKLSISLAGEQMAKAAVLTKMATETGFGAEFIQRMTLAAEKMKESVTSMVDQLNRFKKAVANPDDFKIRTQGDDSRQLSSDFKSRLDELVKLGNFAKNEFVAAFNQATTMEEKYRAAVGLITKAAEQGERLAGLNLGSTFLSEETMSKLKESPFLLQQSLEKADRLSKTKIVDEESVKRAQELNERYEAAVAILSERWIPFQKVLTDLGMVFQSWWVKILELLASGLGTIASWAEKAADLSTAFGDFVVKVLNSIPGLNTVLKVIGKIKELMTDTEQAAEGVAEKVDKAASSGISAARRINEAFTALTDSSKLTKPDPPDMKPWEQAVRSISRHTASLQANAASVGRTAAFHESMRVELQLLTAAQRAGIGVTEENINAYIKLRVTLSAVEALEKSGIALKQDLVKVFLDLSNAAGQARGAMEGASLAAELDFEAKTVFMKEEDVQIARRLRAIFPDITKALQSGQAAQMRTTNAMMKAREVGEQMVNSLQSGFSGFVADLSRGVTLTKALSDNLANVAQSMISIGSKKIFESGMDQAGSSIAKMFPGLGGMGGGVAGLAVGFGFQILSDLLKDNSEAVKAAAENTKKFKNALLDLNKTITGEVLGTIEAQAKAFTDQANQIAEEAQQQADQIAAQNTSFIDTILDDWFGMDPDPVQNFKAMNEFTDTMNKVNEFIELESAKFRETFGASIRSLTAGMGLSSVADEITRLGEKLQAFIKDTNTAFGGDTSKIEMATEASKAMLLSMIDGGEAMSDVEKEMLRIEEASKAVEAALVKLGISAQEAATAVNDSVTAALNKLRDDMTTDFLRDIRSATGRGWINDVQDAMAKFQEGILAGVDPAIMDRWRQTTVQKIIDGAQLTGDAFKQLIALFPELAGQVTEFTEVIDEAALAAAAARQAQEAMNLQLRLMRATLDTTKLSSALAIQRLQQQMEMNDALAAGSTNIHLLQQVHEAERIQTIRDFNKRILDEIARAKQQELEIEERAAEERQRLLEEAQETLDSFARNIDQFITGLLTGSESPLSPEARLGAAQSAFAQQLGIIQTGTPQEVRTAMDSITSYAQDLIDAGFNFFGSGTGGQQIFQDVINQLESLPDQISVQELILEAVETQTSTLDLALANMRDQLTDVLDTGNLADIKASLMDFLPQIDVNTDNALSFAEMQSALGATYPAGTLRSIFNELDNNGNGLITRDELVSANLGSGVGANSVQAKQDILKVSTDNVTAATDVVSNNVGNNDNQGLRDLARLQRSLLELIQQQTDIGGGIPVGVPGIGTVNMNNNILAALNKIVVNTYVIANNTQNPGNINGHQFGILAKGGWVGGGIPNKDSVPVLAMPGEFVVRKSVASRYADALPQLNQTGVWAMGAANSNEIGGLRKDVQQLASMVWAAGMHVGSRVDDAADRNSMGQRHMSDEARQQMRRPSAHGTTRAG